MARILKKIPNFKLPKYKMRDIEDIEELNIEYTPEVIEGLKKKNSKSTGGYQGTEYKTIKEIFLRSTNVYRDRPFILEKFNRKGGFRTDLLRTLRRRRHAPWRRTVQGL